MKVIVAKQIEGSARIAAMLGAPVLVAFKRGGRWWVILDGDVPVEMTVEDYLDREASREG